MVRRIDVGSSIAASGAALVLVSLFLDWFGGRSGWTLLETLDLVLAVLAIAALAAVTNRFGVAGLVPDRVLAPLGAAMVVIVAAALINNPPAAGDDSPDLGIWLGLGGATLVVLGSLLGTARLAVTISISGSKDAGIDDDTYSAPTPYLPEEPGAGER
jgi:hypothetical protein